MDYIGNKCPVCDKYFHIHDDIVVCPECGTPSHRECYTQNGGCINKDKHSEGYDYNKDESVSATDETNSFVCKKCGTVNDENAFFCIKCGNELGQSKSAYNPYQGQAGSQMPNMGPNILFIDPLAGVDKDADFGDGVTAGECAKYVKQNTPYFVSIFKNIRVFSKSRFNFCALLFGGGYLLYRKMYKIGAIFAALQVAIIIFSTYMGYYMDATGNFENLMKAIESANFNNVMDQFYKLSAYDQMMYYINGAIQILDITISLVLGFTANRIYFNHCKKQIIKIKSKNETQDIIDAQFAKKGGVNVPLAISLMVSSLILNVVPAWFI